MQLSLVPLATAFEIVLLAYQAYSTLLTNEVCRPAIFGQHVADGESTCHYYTCTGYGNWDRRLCLNGGGAVPKYYQKKYRNKPTRMNLCRRTSKKCVMSVAEKKGQTEPPVVTPRKPPCVENLGYDCRKPNRECCSDPVQLTCNTGTGRCVDTTSVCECPILVAPDDGARSAAVPSSSGDPSSEACGTVTFTCDEGFDLCNGPRSSTCSKDRPENNATWSSSPPECCPCECPKRPAPSNGVRTGVTPSATGDSAMEACGTVSYTCDDDYQICNGSPSNTCSKRRPEGAAAWDSPAPECCLSECHKAGQPCDAKEGCCLEQTLECRAKDKLSPEDKECCIESNGSCESSDFCCLGLECKSPLGTSTNKKCLPPTVIECDQPLDIVFAVDTSCSIDPGDKTRIRTFMTEFARALTLSRRVTLPNPGMQMAALTFNEGQRPVAYLNESPDEHVKDFIPKIENMNLTQVDCWTHTFAALEAITSVHLTPGKGDRPEAVNVVIVLSDGVTVKTNRKRDTWAEAYKLRQAGAIVLVIGLPQGCGLGKEGTCVQKEHKNAQEEWTKIVGSHPDVADFNPDNQKNLLRVDFKDLRSAIESIGTNLCGRGSVMLNDVLK